MNGIIAILGYRLARWTARLGAGILVATLARRMEQRRAETAAAGGAGAAGGGRAGGRRRLPEPVAALVPGATLAVLKALIDRSGPRAARRRK